MRFGVLGPLLVWTAEGDPVTVSETKVRALLADLLIHGERPVSADRLIEDLWGRELPANPVASLQNKVWHLRRALESAEPGGRDLLVSSPAGYLLRAVPDDAERFTTLIGQAREHGDPRTRAGLLADALSLWRGPAYADFGDEEFASTAVQRLEESRLAALEEQAETRLALGEHLLLVGELGELVARHPLRERLRAAHLLALYRAGRQADALAGYAAFRSQLADELGLDPGSELAALHRAILRQDPSLTPAPARPAPRTNLPAPLTELIGRREAIASARTLLENNRLVTLTGPGGVGKTRLAVAIAHQVADAYPDGVWLTELTAGCDPAESLMAVLGIREEGPASPPAERLVDALRAKRLLLVLDNCEHVVDAAAALSERLLHGAPGLRILATSQEPLAVHGETLWSVPPLALPVSGWRSDAVDLFAARAAAAVPGFTLDDDNAEAAALICRRLDGIPLALELAAARVRALGVHELLARLDDRFGLLTSGRRGAPARQRTLRAMIDWSWALASEPEQTMLCRLAVHADGCTLEAAEAICAGMGLDVVDLLARLVDRSLILTTGDGRYRLLESVSAYCLERLAEAGELGAVRRRHAAYYIALAERAAPHLRGPDQREWLARLDAESAGLRAALEAAPGGPALRLVNAMAWYWLLRGRLTEARRSFDAALAGAESLTGPERVRAVTWQAALALLAGEGNDLVAAGRAALRLHSDLGESGDPAALAEARWLLAFVQRGIGDPAAVEDLAVRALDGFRDLGDRWGIAAALSTLATKALARGDLAAMRRYGEQSMALFRDLGDRWGQSRAGETLAVLAEVTGDYDQAARLRREALRMAEELGLWGEVSWRLSGLGRLALLSGDHGGAQEFHERARRLAADQANRPAEEFAEMGLALGARRQGRLDVAETHLRKWLGWMRRLEGNHGVALALAELGFIAEQRGDADTAHALHSEGYAIARATGDPRAIALALEGLAGARALAGEHEHAARLLGEAIAIRESVGAPLPPAERGDVDRIAARIHAALGNRAVGSSPDR